MSLPQPDMFGLTQPVGMRDLSIQDRFNEFHRLNPHVYDAIRDLAMLMVRRGRKKIGIKMLIEILRWNYFMQTDDPTCEFKISNDYTSRYARLLMKQEPKLDGLFQINQLRETLAE